MYVWSKVLVIGLLAAFGLLFALFLAMGGGEAANMLKTHTIVWIVLNYFGLQIWLFVWMIDQTRVRGKNIWIWLGPFLVAPLPTLMVLILYLLRPLQPSAS
jgi:hypothetical protein